MENVTYQTSGALNRNHFALVSKQEHALSSQEADKATWECFHSIKRRMTRPSNGTASSFSGLLAGVRGWGLDIPTSSGWDSRQVREDLLLLLYCRTSLNESGGSNISTSELRFALPAAFTLAEAGKTIEECRAGYLFCTQVLPPGHEMQLLLINTIRKHLDSSSIGRIVLALNAIIASPNADIVPAISSRLEDLLNHHSPQIRRRAINAFRLLSPFEPEILQKCLQQLPSRLKDTDADVKLSALPLLEVCFENGYIVEKDLINTLLEFIKAPKLSRKNVSFNLSAARALQTLQKIITQDNLDTSELISTLLRLSVRAVTQHSWSLLLACMRTLSRFPSPVVMDHFSKMKPDEKHPIFFLRPLLRTKDINITLVLLQTLTLLPVEAWAGGNIVASGTQGVRVPGVGPTDPSSSSIDETNLFGEGVDDEAGGQNIIMVTEATTPFPALFEESEVGIIMGYLKSSDPSIRKLTIQILARTDPSQIDLIGQYLGGLLDAAKHTVTTGVIVDPNRRTNLIVQALEIAEVTTGSDGKAYADSVMDILLQVDGEDRGRTPSSPTPSNGSNLTAGTSRSARGRSGVVDEAVEMVLTRARNDSSFFQTFSETLIGNFITRQKEDGSITLLVICAATACEMEDIQADQGQQLLDLFSNYLVSTSLSIQETLILSMLRLVAVDGIAVDKVTSTVRDLRQRSGRHMQNRCLQFLDQMTDLTKWKTIMHSIKPLNLPNILAALEKTRTTAPSTSASQFETTNSASLEQRSLGLSDTVPQKQLRYTAYENPTTKEATGSSKPRDLRANLFREKISQSQARRGYMDASDLIELASEVNLKERSSQSPKGGPNNSSFKSAPLESTSSPIQQLSVDDSPFEDSPTSPLPDISISPFLSRTKSPPISPRLSGSGLLRSPPLSSRLTLTPRGSPSSRLPQLPSNESKQDIEVTFDIRWDRLGVQAGTTTRGWFEGDASQILHKLQNVPDVRVVLLHTDSTETRIEIQQASHSGLMKLRQEEDESTLWLLRSGHTSLKGIVKGALL